MRIEILVILFFLAIVAIWAMGGWHSIGATEREIFRAIETGANSIANMIK